MKHFEYAVKPHKWLFTSFAISTLLINSAPSYGQTALTLNDVLAATLETQARPQNIDQLTSSNRQALDWIDGTPKVALTYLHNQTAEGSKEGELSLSLPIKSRFRKAAEANLRSNVVAVQNSAQQQFALYYSGLIRELLWQYQAEQVALELVEQKHQILTSLVERYRDMADANALPQYVVFMLLKEANSSQVRRLTHQHKLTAIFAQYTATTGLTQLPKDFLESLPTNIDKHLNEHPDLIALDRSWQAFKQSLQSQSKQAEPWNVQVVARRIEAGEFNENQLGLGVEFPISLGEGLSSTQRSEWHKENTRYLIERRKISFELLTSTKSLLDHYQFLTDKQAMLSAGASNLAALEQSLTDVLASNPENPELLLRNLIDLIDAKGEATLNQIAMQHQIAKIRQTAGLSL